MASANEGSAGTVGPLERGLSVLRIIAAHHAATRPAELVRATGLARSTVDRVATTLVRLGYLRASEDDERDLRPAPRLLDLGDAYLSASGIADPLEPLARALAERLDESVSLAVPDGDGVRFITQTTRRRAMSLSFRIGDLLPAERCAPGALFAAGWGEEERAAWLNRRQRDPLDEEFTAVPPRGRASAEGPAEGPAEIEAGFRERVEQAKKDGYALDDQLIEPGLVAVAVPIPGDGAPVAALSVVSHTSRHGAEDLVRATLGELQSTAREMARTLAERPASGPPAAAAPIAYSPEDKADLGPDFLQSLARGLTVLSALGAAQGGLTLSEAAEAAGLARATARRSLLTLEQLGYVGYEAGGRRFQPLPRVLELGYARMSRLSFPEIAEPHLAALSARLGESTSVAVLDGDDIRYVARVPTRRIMSVNITIGTRFPAHATSMGRVLLAGLPTGERDGFLARVRLEGLTRHTVTDRAELGRVLDRVAAEGYALVDQELEEGLRSIAVPLRDREGRVAAALNVSMHAGRVAPDEERHALLPALRETATAIERDWARVARRARVRAA